MHVHTLCVTRGEGDTLCTARRGEPRVFLPRIFRPVYLSLRRRERRARSARASPSLLLLFRLFLFLSFTLQSLSFSRSFSLSLSHGGSSDTRSLFYRVFIYVGVDFGLVFLLHFIFIVCATRFGQKGFAEYDKLLSLSLSFVTFLSFSRPQCATRTISVSLYRILRSVACHSSRILEDPS